MKRLFMSKSVADGNKEDGSLRSVVERAFGKSEVFEPTDARYDVARFEALRRPLDGFLRADQISHAVHHL